MALERISTPTMGVAVSPVAPVAAVPKKVWGGLRRLALSLDYPGDEHYKEGA